MNILRLVLIRFNICAPREWKRAVDSHLNEAWLEERLELFREYCLPSLLSQSFKNFRIILLIDQNTNPSFIKKLCGLSNQIDPVLTESHIETGDDALCVIQKAMKDYLQSKILKDGESAYPLLCTTRLDSDDALAPDYMECLNEAIQVADGEALRLGQYFYFSTGQQYISSLHKYKRFSYPGNAFGTYVEKFDLETLKTVMFTHHPFLYKEQRAQNIISDKFKWCMVIHGGNVSNVESGTELSVPDFEVGMNRVILSQENSYGTDSTKRAFFELTFPSEEAEYLEKVYKEAEVILEYGSGGSTILAASCPDKFVFSVESDKDWAERLQERLNVTSSPAQARVYHVDIGETGAWGRPKNEFSWRKFYHYPMKIWDEPWFKHPDVILIDGRFRAACFIHACMRVRKSVTILFDDYVNRSSYKCVEKIIPPERIIGRMAVFKVTPGLCDEKQLAFLCQQISNVTLFGEKGAIYEVSELEGRNPYFVKQNSAIASEISDLKEVNQSLKLKLEYLSDDAKALKEKLANLDQVVKLKNAELLRVRSSQQQLQVQLKQAKIRGEEFRTNFALLKEHLHRTRAQVTQVKKLYLSEIKAAASREKEITKLLASAMAWQKRGKIKRAFSRWKISKQSFKKLPLLKSVAKSLDAGEDVNVAIEKIKFSYPSFTEKFKELADGLMSFKAVSSTNDSVKPNPSKQETESSSSEKFTPSALLDAYKISVEGNYTKAIEQALNSHAPEFQYGIELLRANEALSVGNEEKWLKHLNVYLSQFEIAPILLDGTGDFLSRLSTDDLPSVEDGPMISVIMPAWNAEKSIKSAAQSILNQTWRSIELLIVDDASTDDTWDRIQEIVASDTRVRALRNSVNVGPYVSKNMALNVAKGEWITGHDADDWAHPQRLERHIRAAFCGDKPVRASLTYMVRFNSQGYFNAFSNISAICPDGVTSVASISCLFERDFLKQKLGYWDCVRFGGDSEMIQRTEKILGSEFKRFLQLGMLCLSSETGLTNHPEFGIKAENGELSQVRRDFMNTYKQWHKISNPEDLYMAFPHTNRPYSLGPEIGVPQSDIDKLLSQPY